LFRSGRVRTPHISWAIHPFRADFRTYEEGDLGFCFRDGGAIPCFISRKRHAGLLPDDANARARAPDHMECSPRASARWSRHRLETRKPPGLLEADKSWSPQTKCLLVRDRVRNPAGPNLFPVSLAMRLARWPRSMRVGRPPDDGVGCLLRLKIIGHSKTNSRTCRLLVAQRRAAGEARPALQAGLSNAHLAGFYTGQGQRDRLIEVRPGHTSKVVIRVFRSV